MSALPTGWNQPAGLPQARPLERTEHRGPDRGTAPSVPLRSEAAAMLSLQNYRAGTYDTMTTRSAALASICLTVLLLSAVAVAALFSGEVSERNLGIVTTVLASIGTVLTGLLLFLRVETLNSKTDVAAEQAAHAAEKASRVEKKVDAVHHDVLNGGLRANVKKALREERDERLRGEKH